jgi:hypothetical protein
MTLKQKIKNSSQEYAKACEAYYEMDKKLAELNVRFAGIALEKASLKSLLNKHIAKRFAYGEETDCIKLVHEFETEDTNTSIVGDVKVTAPVAEVNNVTKKPACVLKLRVNALKPTEKNLDKINRYTKLINDMIGNNEKFYNSRIDELGKLHNEIFQVKNELRYCHIIRELCKMLIKQRDLLVKESEVK